MDSPGTTQKHTGSCHCGDVRFDVEVDATKGSRCNCSICTKLSTTGAIVKPEKFTLLTGEEKLSTYEWGGKTATRYFCKNCGVTCFSRGSLPQLGGAYVSVNLNCIDDIDVADLKLQHWDGRHNNWQAGPRDTAWPLA